MDCYFSRRDNSFVIGNKHMEKEIEFKEGRLLTVSVKNKAGGVELLDKGNNAPVQFSYEGLTESIYRKYIQYPYVLEDVKTEEIRDSIYEGDNLRVTFLLTNRRQGIIIKRTLVIYENVPALRTFMEVKTSNFPMGEFYGFTMYNVLDSFSFNGDRFKLRSVEFFTRTDKTNTLTLTNDKVEGFDRGSLIFGDDKREGGGFFLLKEGPCYSDTRCETDGNYFTDGKKIDVLGWGIRPEEFKPDEFMKTYGSVIGVYSGDENNGPAALKKYQRARGKTVFERDCMVMANPWGDRSCLEHMGEKFVLDELDACRKLGATHYQIDDGWQKRGSLARISANEVLEEDYWEINGEKFTDGFNVIARKAARVGVELALWFAPDSNRLFRNHCLQGEILYAMYKNYGIRKFKIDGVNLRTKESEENLEKLLSSLRDRTGGDITFNLDTTNNPRAGYFMFTEYGNIFLENRYTDWKNYYPWLTLKNLWDLAAFVPTRKLQIEFLNIDRNKDKYPPEDRLAPANYSYEYIFAIAMFANPLCWFEPSALSKEARHSFKRMITLYREISKELFDCDIYPVGDRPSGFSWTGFQAHNSDKNKGYFIIYREYNQGDRYTFKPLFVRSQRLVLRNLMEEDDVLYFEDYGERGIEIHMEKENDFRIYEYQTDGAATPEG